MLGFKGITLSDKKLFDSYFNKFPPKLSEFTFTNLFVWRRTKNHEFAVFDNHLVISFSESENSIRKFYQPIGENPAGIIEKLFSEFPESSFERIEESVSEKLSEKFSINEDRNMFDYIYNVNELAELKGDKYGAKRNFIKRFTKYKPEVCSLDEGKVKAFLELQEKWCNIRNCRENESMYAEDLAIRESLENFKELGISGCCVSINGIIEGFLIGEPLNENTFVDHFEKANTDFKGIYQFLLNDFVKRIPEKYTFLNREQDLGIEGLRKSKLSYYPINFIKKYAIKK